MKPYNRGKCKQELIDDLDRVGGVVNELYRHRFVYDRIVEIALANPRVSAVPNHLWFFLARIFSDSVLVGVRRALDPKAKENRTASLGTIVRRLEKHPDIITRTEFASGCASNDLPADITASGFTRLAGQGEELDPDLLRCRLEDVERQCAPILDFVNMRIAHSDRSPKGAPVKWEEADDAIDAVGELYCDLRLLLTQAKDAAAGTDFLKPCPKSREYTEWTKVFEVPWIDPPEHATL